jgi:hypothetical protein
MSHPKVKPYSNVLKDMMGKKSYVLSKAQALSEVGMLETAQSLFLSAAVYEERIAPLLDTLGRELEAALHRISAASCYQKAGHLSCAVNLYRAALSGPLRDDTRAEVEQMLHDCLGQLTRQPTTAITPPRMQEAAVTV